MTDTALTGSDHLDIADVQQRLTMRDTKHESAVHRHE
jgi:hypothetical protein